METTASQSRPAYRKPLLPRIGRGDNTERLYRLEDKRDAAFKAAAEELQKVLGLEDFWREALPEAIFAQLDHWDRQAGEIATIAFLESRGYTVTKS